MTSITEQVFENFEKNHLDSQKTMKIDLFDMMVLYTSSVVISGFLGMEALKEKLNDQSIAQAHLNMINMGVMTIKDPLALLFGQKLVQKKWRKCDKDLVELNQNINSVL